jgi:hypothetical protein
MNFRLILASMAFAGLGFAMPALAQAPAPEAEAVLQQYIASHPEVQRNPSLLDNPSYLSAHPDIGHFIQTHPYVRQQTMRMGAYDTNHQWRDEDWWHKNDPNWVNQHHPEWNQSHPQWANQGGYHGEGAYDNDHRWQNRQWWMEHHPNWVKEHHPQWAEAHPSQPPPGHYPPPPPGQYPPPTPGHYPPPPGGHYPPPPPGQYHQGQPYGNNGQHYNN